MEKKEKLEEKIGGEMNKKAWELLSPDLKVFYTIHKHSDKKKENIWFSKLVKVLDGEVSKATISKSIDKLYDIGFIDGEWKREGNDWIRTFNVAGEASDFAEELYKRINQ